MSRDELQPLLQKEPRQASLRPWLRLSTMWIHSKFITSRRFFACLTVGGLLYFGATAGTSTSKWITFLVLPLLTPSRHVGHRHHHYRGSPSHGEPADVPVYVRGRPGFASYLDVAGRPVAVTYDGRSLRVNAARTLLLSGSLHPVRFTPRGWALALDEAVRSGLNMVTVYVMWAAHQPLADRPLDWRLPAGSACGRVRARVGGGGGGGAAESADAACDWTLAEALWAAAARGLFVHIRLGPYVCAEYSYGGIPEWLPLQRPGMEMRRLDGAWMAAMEDFLAESIDYLRVNQLLASQGGPIVMAQIENELGDTGTLSTGDSRPDTSSLQHYADWCGDLALSLAPDMTWTMCNGLSANNTITTFNGDFGAPDWLEHRGETGRIQVDQPAMWTEDEGGFQVWGEDPSTPTDYFWGRNARTMAYTILRWFARGGAHHNYYMFAGGENFGRTAAAGITTMYASDAVLCSSGQRHEPKFTHLKNLHHSLATVAHAMVYSESALFMNRSISILSPDKSWQTGKHQQMFLYQACDQCTEAIFAENNANHSVISRIRAGDGHVVFQMGPFSSVLFVNGTITFDSAAIDPRALSYTRRYSQPLDVVNCSSFHERIRAYSGSNWTRSAKLPIEQTMLMVNASTSSDYAWYETSFNLQGPLLSATLHVETSQANAMIIYLDDQFVGQNDTHNHKEGNATLSITLGDIGAGEHMLSILSESLGYGNLIGRWGASTLSKPKGIVGGVWVSSPLLPSNMSLVDGREWISYPGLHGERGDFDVSDTSSGGAWSTIDLKTPSYDPSTVALFLELRRGRGHVYLNGFDLGRYWNITRGNSKTQSQRFYFLPSDLLSPLGTMNELKWFDAFGGSCEGYRLLLSWIDRDNKRHGFEDEVAYPGACI